LKNIILKNIKKLEEKMSEKNYKVIESKELSTAGKKRYIVVDIKTGEVMDDAQGYGYKSIKNAYSAFAYKTRDKSKDKEKKQKELKIKSWMSKNKGFVKLMDQIAFEIQKGSWGPDDKFDTAFLKKMLEENNIEIEFSASELLKFWRRI
jgi:hypothetical protein